MKKNFRAASCLFYTQLFWSLSRDISLWGRFSLFGFCHVTFACMEPLSFFGRFVQKVIAFCFSFVFHSFVQKTTQQSEMAAVVSQLIPRFYTNLPKNSLFSSAIAYEEYIVSKEYCKARHDDKMCLLHNCRYHIISKGDIKELLQKVDAFSCN